MHSIFDKKYTRWLELEEAIASIGDTTEKGSAFEQFVCYYFEYHKDFYQIAEVFCDKVQGKAIPKEIRTKCRLEKKDNGVDGANLLISGDVTAWQAKFRSGRAPPTGTELATFWTEAEYAENRCIIANCTTLPQIAIKKKNHQQILVDRLRDLELGFFDALYQFAQGNKPPPIVKFDRRPHQAEMIDDVVKGLKENNRGKLIAACGTGKTLAALWISEDMKAEKVLFLAPSLALLRQTLEEWSEQQRVPFSYICVCSDKTIDSSVEDATVLPLEEMDIPVSTNPTDVGLFLANDGGSKKVVFSTYQSLDVIRDALKSIEGFIFDLIVFDEAHRTAGVKSSDMFALAIDDVNIPSRKRLFMTATERLVNPRIRKLVDEAGLVVLSMDDPAKYGPILHRLNFGTAIKKGIISDYQIVLAGVSEREIYDLVKSNRILEIKEIQPANGAEISAQDLFKQILLIKAIGEFDIKKTVTFHYRLDFAREFIRGFAVVAKASNSFGPNERMAMEFVEGRQTSAERAEIIERFEEADLGILSNVRCLAEGVDIPLIDAIFFSDTKDSQLEIVQAVGRALRQPYGQKGKIARIIVPILIPESNKDLKVLNDDDFFLLHNVVQAMRDQDEELAEWINELNLSVVRGRARHHERTSKIAVSLPEEVLIQDFEERISIRIGEFNGDPAGTTMGYGNLGKFQRKSTFKTVITPLGDYTIDLFEKSLVQPTLSKFTIPQDIMTRKNLEMNNNNISHTERLGLIRPVGGTLYQLTSLGQRLYGGELQFGDVFKNQMLLYSKKEEGVDIFPYRMLAEVLILVDHLNYVEFLYGPYLIRPSDDSAIEIAVAAQRIEWIRSNYPDHEKVSIVNHDAIREALNDKFSRKFDDKEVWSDRQTHGNRFGYFRNHLGAFGDIFHAPPEKAVPISLKETGKEKLRKILNTAS